MNNRPEIPTPSRRRCLAVRNQARFFGCTAAVVLAAAPAFAQLSNSPAPKPAGERAEPVVPKAHPVDRYLEIWKNSPFQREAAPVAAPMQKSFARDYAVYGFIGDEKNPAVTLINKKTREYIRITDPPGEEQQGFELVKVVEGRGPRDITVTVTKDGETADLTFDNDLSNAPAVLAQVTPTNAKAKLNQAGGRAPGARPNITRPGMTMPAGGTTNTQGNLSQQPTGAVRAPVSKPKPPTPQASSSSTQATSSGSIGEDLAPSPASRRRVVLPTRTN